MIEKKLTTNVIPGPWKQAERADSDESPPEEGAKRVKVNHIADTLMTVVPILFNNLALAGFQVDEEEADIMLRDGTLIVEAIKSILCKHYGVYHPLQEVAQHIFKQIVEDDPESLDFVSKLELELQPIEPMGLPFDIEDQIEEMGDN